MYKKTILITYMLLILTTSMIPMDQNVEGLNFPPDLNPTMQNILHVPVYAVLAVLWLHVTRQQKNTKKRILFVILMTAGYGILNELIQFVVPGRYPSILDVCSNSVGALGGVVLYLILFRSDDGFARRIVCG